MSDPADLTTLDALKQWLGLGGIPIAAVTRANPGVVTTSAPNALLSGLPVGFNHLGGMVELNGQLGTVTVLSPASFSIGIDTSAYSVYTSGGFVGVSDALLSRMITACSVFIQSWLNRTIRSLSYAETRNGLGGERVVLKNYPVTAVSSLVVNGITVAPRPALGAGTWAGAGWGYGYVFDDVSIMLDGARFPRGWQNIAIGYTAGFASTPADIEQACIDLIGDWFKYKDRIGKLSEGIEGQTISFTNTGLPTRSMSVLQQYKNVVPPI